MENYGLKTYRESLGVTIKEASRATGVPFRTYIRYESDDEYGNALKRRAIIQTLKDKYEITEDNGILSLEAIKSITSDVFSTYGKSISYCYLFGSYSKGYQTARSDVDLLISATLKGLEFVGLIEELRQKLHKKVDLIRLSDLKDNMDLINEVMKDGIKIYEQHQG